MQRHALTGSHRLLDAAARLRLTGDFDKCLSVLEATDAEPFAQPNVVLLLHGLGRTRRSMAPLRAFLQDAGFDAATVGYASTRANIDAHADGLRDVLDGIPPGRRVHLVAHSLGNLVIRRFFKRHGDVGQSWGGCVMLAPPNNGSILARRLDRVPVVAHTFRVLFGKSAIQIAAFDRLVGDLATATEMPLPVGVVGTRSRLPNPLATGGDFIVTLDETRLDGSTHLELPGHHAVLMRDPAVMRQVAAFLRTGHFDAATDAPPPLAVREMTSA